MYSLFVNYLADKQSSGSFTISRDRFLEYTEDRISRPLKVLSTEAIECLCSWPCVLTQEGRSNEVARVVRISDVTVGRTDLVLTLRPTAEPLETTNAVLWKLSSGLDIGEFEFARNHWAVKEKDLFAVLESGGISVPAGLRQDFAPKPLPIVERAALLRARDTIAALSHGEIDDLLMEAGIPTLRAGKDLGGKLARARAIIQFALDNPKVTTAENSLFSLFLLRRTKSDGRIEQPGSTGIGASQLPAASTIKSDGRSPNRVFVVHGHNEEARNAVVLFLAAVGLVGIVLHEQANMGQHLLTKFFREAELATFAVVIMTDDDVGRAKAARKSAPRARQNVILELGYFLSLLGQANVCALVSPSLETPSDFDGIVYIKMAADEDWKRELLRELRAARMPVDLSKAAAWLDACVDGCP